MKSHHFPSWTFISHRGISFHTMGFEMPPWNIIWMRRGGGSTLPRMQRRHAGGGQPALLVGCGRVGGGGPPPAQKPQRRQRRPGRPLRKDQKNASGDMIAITIAPDAANAMPLLQQGSCSASARQMRFCSCW